MMIDHGKLRQIDAQIIESEGRDPLFICLLFLRFFAICYSFWLFSIRIVNEFEKKNEMTRFFWIWCEKKKERMSFFSSASSVKYLHEPNTRKGYLTAMNIFDKIAHKNQSQIIKIINLYRIDRIMMCTEQSADYERWMQKYRIGNGNNVQFVPLILIDSINLRMCLVFV